MKIGFNKERLFATTLLAGVATMGVPALVAGGVMLAPTSASADDYTSGNLTGSVVDADGNPVTGAAVTLRSQAQGFERTTTTNANGEYRFTLVPQGDYTVVVAKTGLQTTSSENLHVQVGTSNSYQIVMAAPSGGGDEIVVTAARRTEQFSQTTTGTSIDVGELVERMPVARNITALTLLAPSAVPADTAFGIASGQNLAPASISGASGAENAFFINGLNITNFINGIGGATVPFDFYQTVEVKTGGYQAEFGRATGGVVNAVTKSGSNDFMMAIHLNYSPNELLEDRPNALNRQYSLYDNDEKTATLEIGGPIIKDHLFFYGLGQWTDREFATATGSAAAIPVPPTGTYAHQVTNDPFYGFKIDGYITDTQHLEFTWFDTTSQVNQDLHTFNPTTNVINPAVASNNIVRQGGESWVGRYTGSFTDWLTLSAAYGHSITDQASITDLINIPRVQDIRTNSAGVDLTQNRTAARTDPFLAYREFYRGDVDILFSLHGDHHVRFGLDHEDTTLDEQSTRNGGANYVVRTSGASGNANLGLAPNTSYYERRVFTSGGGFEGTSDAKYIQDSWDVTDRLNVSLGWRLDKMKVSNPLGDTFMNFDHEEAIRAGFSYDAWGDQSAKIYGFYGRYYLPIPSNTSFRVAAPATDISEYFLVPGGTPAFDASGQPVLGAQIVNQVTTAPCPAAGGIIAAPGTDACFVRNPGTASAVEDTVSQNLKSTFEDEYILGYSQQFNNLWSGGVSLTYRNLGRVAEDVGLDHAIINYCARNGLNMAAPGCSPGGADIFRIINPGEDAQIHLATALPNGATSIVLSNALDILLPPIRREYIGLEFTVSRAWDGKWGLDASYTLSKSEGNFEGALKSDIGQVDPGITEDYDFLSFIPGQYGLLPNHRAHQLKIRGSYLLTDGLIAGANVSVFSPRHYGCIGAAPVGYYDPDGDGYGDGGLTNDAYGVPANARFCNGVVVDRGSSFTTDWLYNVDLSFRYDLPEAIMHFGHGTLRMDIFNVFNAQGVQEASENGETAPFTPDPNYSHPTAYQSPRSVRFGFDWNF
ncbi:MAG: carboxypeptidase regulatory-like domain-containing protein [Terricaulis silvestris]